MSRPCGCSRHAIDRFSGQDWSDDQFLRLTARNVADKYPDLSARLDRIADRLAPIEARDVLETIRFHLRRGDHVGADGQRCTQQLLDAIDKALRASESAPAVEK
jgi:hypothetical protein